MNQPIEISPAEWKEIMSVPEVVEFWGLERESPQEFANMVYGAKFAFVSGSLGYVGDIYILQGDYLTGDTPLVLIRQNGTLTLAS